MLQKLNLNGKPKLTAMAHCGLTPDTASQTLSNLFDQAETEADTVWVVTTAHLDFGERLEEFLLVLFADAQTSVPHLKYNHLLTSQLASSDFGRAKHLNDSISGKLVSVAQKVDSHLLKPLQVSLDEQGHGFLNELLYVIVVRLRLQVLCLDQGTQLSGDVKNFRAGFEGRRI